MLLVCPSQTPYLGRAVGERAVGVRASVGYGAPSLVTTVVAGFSSAISGLETEGDKDYSTPLVGLGLMIIAVPVIVVAAAISHGELSYSRDSEGSTVTWMIGVAL